MFNTDNKTDNTPNRPTQAQRNNFKAKLTMHGTLPLQAKAGLAESFHCFDEASVNAIVTAYNIQRPLLVRGDPGLGKSQIAHAIAQCQGWNLLLHVVHSRTEPTDLLYRVDYVKRLATAQLQGALANHTFTNNANTEHHADYQQILSAVDEANFVVPAALWWAYSAETARKFYEEKTENAAEQVTTTSPYHHGYQSALLNEINSDTPSVILIDEIDKADTELPNTLLEVLNNRSFHVPTDDQLIEVDASKPPFVVITSNDERPLPHAFLRRCVVLNLTLADGDAGVQQLLQIAHAHESEFANVSETVMTHAAEQTIERRKQITDGEYKPGTSEFLDLLKALSRGYDEEAEQLEAIEIISGYLLQK